MRISGLQKLTLMDFPEVVSCIIFTQGCNFRCPFCHNASLVGGVGDNEISEDEVLDFLKERKKLLDGVVITGGEPTLNSDIAEFLKKIKNLGYLIKLDTNGTNPDLLKKLVSDKLVDYVAMDIKNCPEKYEKATGVNKFMEKVTQSKDFLLTGAIDYEFRTTVVKGIHTKDDLISLAKWIAGANKYFLQQYKNSGDIISPEGLSSFSEDEMNDFLSAVSPIINSSKIRNL